MDGGLSLCDPRHHQRKVMLVRLLEENLTSNVKTKITKNAGVPRKEQSGF